MPQLATYVRNDASFVHCDYVPRLNSYRTYLAAYLGVFRLHIPFRFELLEPLEPHEL